MKTVLVNVSICGNNVYFKKIADCIFVLRITVVLINDIYILQSIDYVRTQKGDPLSSWK